MNLMSVKKQIPSLCKLYSFYEERPEEFLEKTDVDSYFYHNICGISSPSIEQCELAEAPKKYHLQSSSSNLAI